MLLVTSTSFAANWQYIGESPGKHGLKFYIDLNSIDSEVIGPDVIKSIDVEITEAKSPYTPLGEYGQFVWKLDVDCTEPSVNYILPNSANFPGGVEGGEISIKSKIGIYFYRTLCK
jgi:hypothetical protein